MEAGQEGGRGIILPFIPLSGFIVNSFKFPIPIGSSRREKTYLDLWAGDLG